MTDLGEEAGAPLGAMLQRHRRAAGLTQEDLARRTELSVRTIRNLELGLVRRPRRDTLRRLAAALRSAGRCAAPDPAAGHEILAARLNELFHDAPDGCVLVILRLQLPGR